MKILIQTILIFLAFEFFVSCHNKSNSKTDKTEIVESRQEIQVKQQYGEVKIGEQIWMTRNLNETTFRNGDTIPGIESSINSPRALYYEDQHGKENKGYGLFYNWDAINDKRGLAPTGWHMEISD